jgi:hypothetical protein
MRNPSGQKPYDSYGTCKPNPTGYGGKLESYLGFCRWAFGHADINPGGNLIDFQSRQERAVQRHLAKRADTPR